MQHHCSINHPARSNNHSLVSITINFNLTLKTKGGDAKSKGIYSPIVQKERRPAWFTQSYAPSLQYWHTF